MSTPAQLAHLEILADEPERAILFYTSVFGWNAVKWVPKDAEPGFDSQYWMLTVKHGAITIPFGLRKRQSGERPDQDASVNAYVCTISVASLEQTIPLLEQYGGVVTEPKRMVAPNTYLVGAVDPEGNHIRIICSVAA